MAYDLNARLIAELYATNEPDRAAGIADEMVEIGDPIFPRQIYAAYKRFEKTNVSHFFINDLTSFENNADAANLLKQIAHSSARSADIETLLEYINEIDYLDSEFTQKVKGLFWEVLANRKISEYDVDGYCEYLKRANEIAEFEEILQKSFEDDEVETGARRRILGQILRIWGKKYFHHYYDNYASIVGTRSEILFAKEIATWSKGIIPKIFEKILKEGSESAREIIRTKQQKDQGLEEKKKAGEQEVITKTYSNSDVITDIANLRSKINSKTTSDEKFGFPFFGSSEEIYAQNNAAQTPETLGGYCSVIRATLWGFNEKILSQEIAIEDLKKAIPDAENVGGALNRFHYLLAQKGVVVDTVLFGFRHVQRIVNGFAHLEKEQDLIRILKGENLDNLYHQNRWPELHREILIKYRDALQKLNSAL